MKCTAQHKYFCQRRISQQYWFHVQAQKAARDAAAKQPPAWMGRSWTVAIAISGFIFVIYLVFGFGFGGWASILNFVQNSNTYGAFAACYQCTSATPATTPTAPAG